MVWAAPNDIDELEKIGISREKCRDTYHLGEDEMLEWPALQFADTEEAILFVGTLTWEANIDGLIWFISEVWPLLIAEKPELKFYIVGKNPDERLKSVASPYKTIEFTGFVKDLEPYHKKCRVFVIPLRFGSGIKVKLINALYRGIPAVTTAVGSEGLDAKIGYHLFESSTANQQASDILKLVEDEKVWTETSRNARELGSKYTWKELLRKHDSEIIELIGNQPVKRHVIN